MAIVSSRPSLRSFITIVVALRSIFWIVQKTRGISPKKSFWKKGFRSVATGASAAAKKPEKTVSRTREIRNFTGGEAVHESRGNARKKAAPLADRAYPSRRRPEP